MSKFISIQSDINAEEVIINLDDTTSIYRTGRKLWVSYISSGYNELVFSDREVAKEAMNEIKKSLDRIIILA